MAKFSESTLEEIKKRISLEDLIARYVTLNRKGDRFWGLCPFHDEKTPSFTVVPDRGFFHCFGCGQSGSIFDFVMEMENLSFVEAVEKLAREANVALQEETPQQRAQRTQLEALRDLYDKISNSFNYILLNSKAAQGALNYLNRRGFTLETIKKFNLGYAPNDNDWLYDFLIKKDYSEKLLAQSGLFAKRNNRYPIFKDRLMFPIKDRHGKCVAFGGRDLSGKSQAKYVNSPETALYKKREIVYGLSESKEGMKRENSAIICEGYFDVMALHQVGIDYAIAPLGTSFTEDQGKLVRRYVDKLYTLFDNDDAGIEATKRTLIIGEKLGFETNVITLEDAKDPADLVENRLSDKLISSCRNYKKGFDYLVTNSILLYDSKEASGKYRIFEEVRPFLEAVNSEIVRHSYLRDLANYLQLDEQTVVNDYLKKESPKAKGDKKSEGRSTKVKEHRRSIDLYVMLNLMNNRELFASARSKLKIEDLDDQYGVELYTILEDSCRSGTNPTDEAILNKIADPTLRSIVALSFNSGEFSENSEKVLEESIRSISLRKLEKSRRNIENLLRLAEREQSVAVELAHLLLEKTALDEQIKQLKESNPN